MGALEELIKRMDHVKVLMDATGMSMEELMAYTAVVHIDCGRCPITSDCNKRKYLDCSDVWEKYLKGEFDETDN